MSQFEVKGKKVLRDWVRSQPDGARDLNRRLVDVRDDLKRGSNRLVKGLKGVASFCRQEVRFPGLKIEVVNPSRSYEPMNRLFVPSIGLGKSGETLEAFLKSGADGVHRLTARVESPIDKASNFLRFGRVDFRLDCSPYGNLRNLAISTSSQFYDANLCELLKVVTSDEIEKFIIGMIRTRDRFGDVSSISIRKSVRKEELSESRLVELANFLRFLELDRKKTWEYKDSLSKHYYDDNLDLDCKYDEYTGISSFIFPRNVRSLTRERLLHCMQPVDIVDETSTKNGYEWRILAADLSFKILEEKGLLRK
ncbi:hypothetical protein A2526_06065 [candidate division WOR-1 bacterium RIFOXYD2_FULL_36_8]|uniref:Uncharacterized protein n=1 Tax=candidate division WOR-1 bacterium RIFOXYB2_FULL_36_35 TaxID=1802578 RepID=A0A1F4RYV0_UNCSA|nr:MAG: hypothetical protein A2230_01265 [candidate division WOR-1 bacterium RIFOXYA2_FULL_36_21]OGC13341.1 MAG: hypothetical protein A2290_04755 [candidate division WOR-1 bacterium RIFOXYB2_FULL_36_35]OGC21048.1 MAG: hypothetical protein A2282_08520 [candidate division WOR-1 bacterium RIFOXYA12_FULL_36_13]OGC38869.1 MAG: hypothetical protein A2526_06065 [candidate division WOR-1 bacterium RIFOXYD2_FULL_36_8]